MTEVIEIYMQIFRVSAIEDIFVLAHQIKKKEDKTRVLSNFKTIHRKVQRIIVKSV